MAVLHSTLDQDSVVKAVKDMYEDVAACPGKEFHFPTGRPSCLRLGYPEDLLNAIPDAAVESFAGVGFPFLADVIRPGDTVVDIGSGSGTDVLLAALKTGPGGRVYGIEMTSAMIDKARENILKAGLNNVIVVEGHAGKLPLDDASADVITSNGVVNLVPDKEKAFQEAFRILKPGGRLQLADIVLSKPVSDASKSTPELWAECIVGAEPVETYVELVRSAGFEKTTIIDRLDYFAYSANEGTKKSAKALGAYAIVLTGRKE